MPSPYLASHRFASSSGTITLKCKDLRVLQLEIPGMEECLNIASSIEVSWCHLGRAMAGQALQSST